MLGVDPGHDGAAVLLEGDGAPICAWSWRKRTRKGGTIYALKTEIAVGGLVAEEMVYLTSIGAALVAGLRAARLRPHLVVEGLFVHRKASPNTAIELGRTVGWLTAALLPVCESYHDSAIAGEWRPAVLGCAPNAGSDEAERLALLRWGTRWTGELASDPHVAEADAIAWYRRVGLLGEAQQDLIGGRGR